MLVYSLTKGGLMSVTWNLENALGKEGIRVNQLNVGWTLTENESEIKEGEGFFPPPIGNQNSCATRTHR